MRMKKKPVIFILLITENKKMKKTAHLLPVALSYLVLGLEGLSDFIKTRYDISPNDQTKRFQDFFVTKRILSNHQ